MKRWLRSPFLFPPRRLITSAGALLLLLPSEAHTRTRHDVTATRSSPNPAHEQPAPSHPTLLPQELGWQPLEGGFLLPSRQLETQPSLQPGQTLALVVEARTSLLLQTPDAKHLRVYWVQDPTLERQLLAALHALPDQVAPQLQHLLLQRSMQTSSVDSGQASLRLELTPNPFAVRRAPQGLMIQPPQAGLVLIELDPASEREARLTTPLSLWQLEQSRSASAQHAQEQLLQHWANTWPQHVEPPLLPGGERQALTSVAALSRWLAGELEGTPEPALSKVRAQTQKLLLAAALLPVRALVTRDDARFEPFTLSAPPATTAVTESNGTTSLWLRLPPQTPLHLPLTEELRLSVRLRAVLPTGMTRAGTLRLQRAGQEVGLLRPSARPEWLEEQRPRQTALGETVGPTTLWRAYALPGEPLTLTAEGGELLLQLEALRPLPSLTRSPRAVRITSLLNAVEHPSASAEQPEQSTAALLRESAHNLRTPGIQSWTPTERQVEPPDLQPSAEQNPTDQNVEPGAPRWLSQLPPMAEQRRLITRLPIRSEPQPGQLAPLNAGTPYTVQCPANRPSSLRLFAASDAPGTLLMVEKDGKLRSIPLLQRLEPLRIPLEPGQQTIRWEGEGVQVWLQPDPEVSVEGPSAPAETVGARVPVLRRWARLSPSERTLKLPLKGMPGQRVRIELRGEEGAAHSLDGQLNLTLGGISHKLVYQLREADGEVISDGLEVIRLGPLRTLTLPLTHSLRTDSASAPTSNNHPSTDSAAEPESTASRTSLPPSSHEHSPSLPSSQEQSPSLNLTLEGEGAVWVRVLLESSPAPMTTPEQARVAYQPLAFSPEEALKSLTRLSQQLREAPPEQAASLRLSQAELLASLGLEGIAGQLLEDVQHLDLSESQKLQLEQLNEWITQQRSLQRDPAFVLPAGLAVEGLMLRPSWEALRRGEKHSAWRRLQELSPEEQKSPGALWLTARLGELLQAYPASAEAWRALAKQSSEPGPLWRMAARAELLALEQELASRAQLSRVPMAAELDAMLKAALRGSADAAQAQQLGEPVESLLVSLSRFSRWRTLTHAERASSIEWLGMTPEEAGRTRPLRTQAREALLGLPWPVEEGLLLSPRSQAGVSVSFARPTALRLELFCVDEGGGPLNPSAAPCEVSLLLNGVKQRSVLLSPGRVQVEVHERLSGQHRVEVRLEAEGESRRTRRLAVRVWGEESGPTAALSAAPEMSNAWTNQLAQAEGELTSGRWYPVLPSPRRRVFGARPQEPVEQTVVGPTLLEVESRAWGEPPSTRSNTNHLLPDGKVTILLRSMTGEVRTLEPQKLPTLPDAETWLEARRGARVGQAQRQLVGLPAGVWKVQVVASVSALVSFRVREPLSEALEEELSSAKLDALAMSPKGMPQQVSTQILESSFASEPWPLASSSRAGGPTLSLSTLSSLGGQVGVSEELSEDGLDALEGLGMQLRLSQRWDDADARGLGGGLQGLSFTARGVSEQVESAALRPTGLLRLTAFVGLRPGLRLSLEGLGEVQQAPAGQALRGFARLELAQLWSMQPRLWLRPAVGALIRHDQQTGEGPFAERFVDTYTQQHGVGLTGQLELLSRPLSDLYLSGRLKATSNADMVSLDQLEGRLLSEQLLGGLVLTQELRTTLGLRDPDRSSLRWTPVLGLGARWQAPLGANTGPTRGWRWGLETQLRLEPLSQTWQVQLSLGLEQGPARPYQNAQPGEARFADLLSQQERARQLSRRTE